MSGLLKKMSEKFALVLFLSAVVGLILGLLLVLPLLINSTF